METRRSLPRRTEATLFAEPLPNVEELVLDVTPTPIKDATLESISETVTYAAAAVGGLQDVLERLNASIARERREAEAQAESRLGQLFIRAQQFVDHAVAEAHFQAKTILDEATAEAATIVARAREEATQLHEEAQQAGGPKSDVVDKLRVTMAGFHSVTTELVQELASLQSALVSTPATADASMPPPPAGQVSPVLAEVASLRPASVTAGLSGSWMHDEPPLWEAPNVHTVPARRFWRRFS